MYIESKLESVGFYTADDGDVDYWTYSGGYEYECGRTYAYAVHYKATVDDIFEHIKRRCE